MATNGLDGGDVEAVSGRAYPYFAARLAGFGALVVVHATLSVSHWTRRYERPLLWFVAPSVTLLLAGSPRHDSDVYVSNFLALLLVWCVAFWRGCVTVAMTLRALLAWPVSRRPMSLPGFVVSLLVLGITDGVLCCVHFVLPVTCCAAVLAHCGSRRSLGSVAAQLAHERPLARRASPR